MRNIVSSGGLKIEEGLKGQRASLVYSRNPVFSAPSLGCFLVQRMIGCEVSFARIEILPDTKHFLLIKASSSFEANALSNFRNKGLAVFQWVAVLKALIILAT